MNKKHISWKRKSGIILITLILMATPVISMAGSTNGSSETTGTDTQPEAPPNISPGDGVMGGEGATSGLSTVSIAGIVAGSIAVIGLVAASATDSDSDSSSTSNH